MRVEIVRRILVERVRSDAFAIEQGRFGLIGSQGNVQPLQAFLLRQTCGPARPRRGHLRRFESAHSRAGLGGGGNLQKPGAHELFERRCENGACLHGHDLERRESLYADDARLRGHNLVDDRFDVREGDILKSAEMRRSQNHDGCQVFGRNR